MNKTEFKEWAVAVCVALMFVCCMLSTIRKPQVQEVKTEKIDEYFLCCVERLAQDYYTVVYSKNGECFYPHFTHERQALAFIDHLETLGILHRNGYEIRQDYINDSDLIRGTE